MSKCSLSSYTASNNPVDSLSTHAPYGVDEEELHIGQVLTSNCTTLVSFLEPLFYYDSIPRNSYLSAQL